MNVSYLMSRNPDSLSEVPVDEDSSRSDHV
jgi:hypothetical protein